MICRALPTTWWSAAVLGTVLTACQSSSPAAPLDTPVLPSLGFPLPSLRPIESPYGPRISGGDAEFHQGVDYGGTRDESVLSMLDGVVSKVRLPEADHESLFVIVEHEVPAFQWQGQTLTTLYTSYHHLDSSDVEEDQPVQQGERIGGVGDSGNARTVHLHVELRLGTSCSLEYQLDHPDSSCALGFSPHVDLLMALETEDLGGPSVTVSGRRVTVRAPMQDPDIRRIETAAGTVDFSAWIGIDNLSSESRDDMELAFGTLVPVEDDNDDVERVLHLDLASAPGEVTVWDARGRSATP